MASNHAHPWTRERLSWVAGLFEGEGCIAHNSKTGQWRLIVSSTDEDVILRLQEWTGLGNVRGPIDRGHKPHWTWAVTKRDHVYALLVALDPWLCGRRQARGRECLTAIAGDASAFVARKCKRGHRWASDTVIKRKYGGRMRRVCKACLELGIIEIRSEVS